MRDLITKMLEADDNVFTRICVLEQESYIELGIYGIKERLYFSNLDFP